MLRVPNAALRFRPAPDVIARMRGEKPDAKQAASALRRGGGTAHARATRREGGSRRSARSGSRTAQTAESTVLHTGVSDGTLTEVLEGKVATGDKLVTDVARETRRLE